MRACRSSSPRCKPCYRNLTPDCYKPCCLPRRRCQSLSPRRPSRQFYEQQSCSPCDGRGLLSCCTTCRPCDVTCSPRSRKSRLRGCSPCRPRRCCSRDPPGSKYCLPTICGTRFGCNYMSCDTPSPYKRDICSPRSCDPCYPCVPKRKPCYPRMYDSRDPCCPLSCRTGFYRRWDPCTSCDPCYPVKCGLSCTPWRRQTSCATGRYCEPCYSPLVDTLKSRLSETCRLRYGLPCGDSSKLARMKLRDLTCDNFRKVCYPKEVPIKSCTVPDCRCDFCNCSCATSCEPHCEVTKVDPCDDAPDEGYDAHLCPWEADVSISGTVKGHCTSTALEVARRMSGRFRAEGDRYTTDSCENNPECTTGTQRMSLGRLDDGTALDFSRNNDPQKKITHNKNSEASKRSETLQSPTLVDIGSRGSSRNQHTKDKRGKDESCYSAVCRDNLECALGNTRALGVASGDRTSVDDIMKGQKSCSSRRPSHHSVRFGSENEESDYQSASEMKSHQHYNNNQTPPFNEVHNFLNSRKDRRQRNIHISSPTKGAYKKTMQNNSTIHRPDDQRYTTPSSHSLRRHKADDCSDALRRHKEDNCSDALRRHNADDCSDALRRHKADDYSDALRRHKADEYSDALRRHKADEYSDDDCRLFTPSTQCSPLGVRNYSPKKSTDDVDNIVLHSLNAEDFKTRKRLSECQEISLENSRVPISRLRGFKEEQGVSRILGDRRIRERY